MRKESVDRSSERREIPSTVVFTRPGGRKRKERWIHIYGIGRIPTSHPPYREVHVVIPLVWYEGFVHGLTNRSRATKLYKGILIW